MALIIGNGNYSAVTPLDNPTRDADLIARTLRDLDFEVTLLIDTPEIDMKRAIAQFGRDLRAAGPDAVGLFYYAGHGVQSFGSNYLLPVDADLTDAADLDLIALEADAVLRQMASARNKTNIVILDACRNNPFEQIPQLNDNGLAEMRAPRGTYLAYATEPGGVALDGLSDNSPFTEALASEITKEGAAIEAVFKAVRVSVIEKTGGAQTPWDTSSLTSNFMFKAATPASQSELAELQLWNSVRLSKDPVQLMLFLRAHPEGRFNSEARALLREAMAAEIGQDPAQGTEVSEPDNDTAEVTSSAPSQREAEMLEAARVSGELADYEAYLAEFPQGAFAALAKLEIDAINKRAPAQEEQVAPTPEPVAQVLFDVPLTTGPPEILGKTISEIAELAPLYPPVDGIPEELWKDQTCSTCHQWTRDDLCAQGKTYLKQSAARSLEKQHPLGGGFKSSLRNWAEGGCQ